MQVSLMMIIWREKKGEKGRTAASTIVKKWRRFYKRRASTNIDTLYIDKKFTENILRILTVWGIYFWDPRRRADSLWAQQLQTVSAQQPHFGASTTTGATVFAWHGHGFGFSFGISLTMIFIKLILLLSRSIWNVTKAKVYREIVRTIRSNIQIYTYTWIYF